MTRTTELTPGTIEVTPNQELITGCNICGESAYRVVRRDPSIADSTNAYVATGLKLFDMTYSPNGFQTYVTRLCVKCAATMRDALKAAV
ncbi:MAG TPA: hypothetical protein VEU73_13220 [Gemmatimonadales bacterium]|nr:hypothetical protein [Gemmatimonadales bacterium]